MDNVIIGVWIWNKILGLNKKQIRNLVRIYFTYSMKIESKLQEKNSIVH